MKFDPLLESGAEAFSVRMNLKAGSNDVVDRRPGSQANTNGDGCGDACFDAKDEEIGRCWK